MRFNSRSQSNASSIRITKASQVLSGLVQILSQSLPSPTTSFFICLRFIFLLTYTGWSSDLRDLIQQLARRQGNIYSSYLGLKRLQGTSAECVGRCQTSSPGLSLRLLLEVRPPAFGYLYSLVQNLCHIQVTQYFLCQPCYLQRYPSIHGFLYIIYRAIIREVRVCRVVCGHYLMNREETNRWLFYTLVIVNNQIQT